MKGASSCPKDSYKAFKSFEGSPNPQKVAQELRSAVQAFKKNMPIIQARPFRKLESCWFKKKKARKCGIQHFYMPKKMWDDFYYELCWILYDVWLLVIFYFFFHHLSHSKFCLRKVSEIPSPFQMAWPWGHQPQRRACVSRPSKPPICCSSLRQLIAGLIISWGFLALRTQEKDCVLFCCMGKVDKFWCTGVPKPDLLWFCDIWRSLWRDNYDTRGLGDVS